MSATLSPAGMALTGAVRTWQLLARPVLGPNCRFHPGCSDYAVEAICVHGAGRGGLLAARRVLRCHPWNPGGHDPVPPAEPADRD
ncbi:MAG TPA: membrane protein insertion efficiency factor YidD [Acetobacteraceae bacterium]|nr:membrane protein insertion efficiency factor YidD [Acetobacteraceae bacterium]